MGKSKKKTPITTVVSCKSQKAGKTRANRLFRRIAKMRLKCGMGILPIKSKELTDPWNLGGDGKRYWKTLEDKYYRK